MTEDYGIQVTFTLPPVAAYEKGAMLNLRGKGPRELAYQLKELRDVAEDEPVYKKFLDHFSGAEAQAPPKSSKTTRPKPSAPESNTVLSTVDVAEVLGAAVEVDGDAYTRADPPTEVQKAVAKQRGVDLEGKTSAEAAVLIKAAKLGATAAKEAKK